MCWICEVRGAGFHGGAAKKKAGRPDASSRPVGGHEAASLAVACREIATAERRPSEPKEGIRTTQAVLPSSAQREM